MKFTREGKRFLLATLLIGFAAFNTGNNLIFLILSMMLSFLLLSFVILRVNMHRLTLGILQDQAVYAKRLSRISVTLTNHKKSFIRIQSGFLHPEEKKTVQYFPWFAALQKHQIPYQFTSKREASTGSVIFLLNQRFPSY